MMDLENLQQVMQLLKAEKAFEARKKFEAIVPSDTVEYLMVKGKLEQKFQNWGKALNAFNEVVEIEPENVEAQNHIRIIKGILNFWNPEMFNP